MKKLSDEQLKRYVASQEERLAKGHVVVDEKHRKNLQAWISYDLWMSIKARIASEGISMNKYIEEAIATYLLLEDEDIERILARHQK